MDEVPIVVQLLKSWDQPDAVIAAFVGSQIDDITKLNNINASKLEELIPNLEQRSSFIQKWMEFREQILEDPSDGSRVFNFVPYQDVNHNTANSSSFTPLTALCASAVPQLQIRQKTDYLVPTILPPNLPAVPTGTIQLSGDQQEEEQPLINREPPVSYQESSWVVHEKFRAWDLKAALCTDSGRAVLEYYRKSNSLSDKVRDSLITIVTEAILTISHRIECIDFIVIRNKIIDLFPAENPSVFYIPPKSEGNRLAKGKLFDKVRNRLAALRKAGLAPHFRSPAAASVSHNENVTEPHITPDERAALEFVRRCQDICSESEEKWQQTSAYRMQILYGAAKRTACLKRRKRKRTVELAPFTEDSSPTCASYMNDYKILQQPKGYRLLEIDFIQIHGEEKSKALFAEWGNLSKKLIALIKKRDSKIEDPVGKELIGYLEEDNLPQDALDSVLIQLLPSLCTPRAFVQVGKRKLKPSIAESRDSFVLFVTVANDLERRVEERKRNMNEMSAPVQPYMIFLGPTRKNIVASYVCVDTTLYKVDSVLHALDCCFKVCHGLCASYAPQCKQVWFVLHSGVYKLPVQSEIDGEEPTISKTFVTSLKSLAM